MPDINLYWAYMYRVYARFFYETNNCEGAVRYSNKSSEIFDSKGMKKEAAKNLQFAIDAETKQGNHEAALKLSQQAIRILQKEGGNST